ncbi:PREDICTED: uncharacterized protein LOC107161623 [Diuraphis noxia]|uniref:uncharacterized protein LOC107161623 n=1 Tax=Diuraphis noxia TaxID=143948 RepID=UPI0007635A40|nr:PREDICTED: uncharacterized protein LOC107161623 [Diuraphis noxia]
MDDFDFDNCRRRSEFFEAYDYRCGGDIRRSPSRIVDALDLAVQRPPSTVHVRPLERLSGRWTFRSMPQDVNLAAYGKQFSGEWPSFRVEMDCGSSAVNTTTSALVKRDTTKYDETQDGGILSWSADEKDSSTSNRPNAFAGQCVTYVGRVFSWDFYRTVYLFFQKIVKFRNRR